MSKADKLGGGASFGRARPVSARRAAISAATGAQTEAAPAVPTSVAVGALAHNPLNPREELTELEETAASLAEKGQIQPLAVVRRAAFLASHPGQEEALGSAEYVVIDGNRRLAAASLAGLNTLRIDVNDTLASTAEDVLEAALIANVHRVDVAPMDQAKALSQLITVHGSQATVAKRLGKTPAWVSQRLALLELTDDLQEKVQTGELKVKPARRIGRLPKEEQQAAAAEAIAEATAPRQRSRRTLATGPTDASVNPVNAPAPSEREHVPAGDGEAASTPPPRTEPPASNIDDRSAAINPVNDAVPAPTDRKTSTDTVNPVNARSLSITTTTARDVAAGLVAALPAAQLAEVTELLQEHLERERLTAQ